MRSSKSCLFGAALLLVAFSAAAEEPVKPYPQCSHQPTEGDVAGAKGAFQAGQASFNEGDYKRAIDYWEDAYRRDCTAHDLLLNLARAYELDDEKHHAVSALETYLARNPSSPQRDQIARRIEVLNEKIGQEASSGAGTPPPNTDGEGTAKPVHVGVVKDTEPQGKRPITPLIVAGAGGVLFIAGAILYSGASGDAKDAEDACKAAGGDGRQNCPANIADDGNSARKRQKLWGVVTVVGLAGAVGGTVWYFLSPREKASAQHKPVRIGRPRLEPVLGRGFAGVGVSGAF